MNKLEEYNDIIQRLVAETVSCTPAEWDHATLTIDCDGRRIDYKLKNAEQPGSALISEALRTLTEELYVRMSRQGDTWTQAVVTFNRKGDDVSFDTSFEYAQASSPSLLPEPTPAQKPAVKKPWWKFGSG